MTRETRIGLLVGLVFIVMFGIVLADMTNTNKTTPAEPPIATGPGGDTHALPPVTDELPPAPVIEKSSEPATGDPHSPLPTEYAGAVRPASEGTIRLYEEPISKVELDSGSDRTPVVPGTETVKPPVPPVATATVRTYVVEAGDTPTKIAKKFYGPTRGADYKKIMDANKNASPTALKVGMKLVIPDAPEAAPAPSRPAVAAGPATPPPAGPTVSSATTPTTPVRPLVSAATTRPAATATVSPLRSLPREATISDLRTRFGGTSGSPTVTPTPDRVAPATPIVPITTGGKTYVVKAGDSLSKIAREYKTTVDKIYIANKDKMDSPNDLQAGETLTIPG